MPGGVAKTDGSHCLGPFWGPAFWQASIFQKSVDPFGMSKVSIPLFGYLLIANTEHQGPTIKIHYLANMSYQGLPTYPGTDSPLFSLQTHSLKKTKNKMQKAKQNTCRCCCLSSVCLPLQPPLLLAPLGYCIFFVLRMWCLGVCCDG